MSTPEMVLLSWGWALLHSVWQGALLAAVAWPGLHLTRDGSPRVSYALSYSGLLALLAALPLTASFLYLAAEDRPPGRVGVPGDAWLALDPRLHSASPPAGGLPGPAGLAHDVFLLAGPALPWVLGAWTLGVVVLLLRVAGGWCLTRRLRREASRPTPVHWRVTVASLAPRLHVRTAVGVRESDRVEVPAVVGCLRPLILLPTGLARALGPAQVEAILAHELAHVRRRDVLANLVQVAAETLLFFHPVAWWLSRRARMEREHCCDDIAVALSGNVLGYARALTRLEEARSSLRLGTAATDGALLPRIRRLVAPEHPPGRGAGSRLAGVLVLLGSGVLLAASPHLLEPSVKDLAGRRTPPPQTTIRAEDPGGAFTLTLQGGRAVAATISGEPISSGRLRQSADSVWFLGARGEPLFAVALKPEGGGITWHPRMPRRVR
ncbi:MAG TPA: M56 family metallopeptidase [Longimicrobiaceae bacterium]|nr:M56 family metallopeptidase [Longimicrobiaceae bacterium]